MRTSATSAEAIRAGEMGLVRWDGRPPGWVWCGQRGSRRAEKWRGAWAGGGGGGCPWPRSRQRDLRERAVPSGGQWKALPSCRGWRQGCYWMPCGWVAASGGKYVGKHRPSAAPLLTGQRPHPQWDTGFSQPSLPASLPPRCLTFCLLVPATLSLGISTSGPLLKRFALPGVSFLQTRLRPPGQLQGPSPGDFVTQPHSPLTPQKT